MSKRRPPKSGSPAKKKPPHPKAGELAGGLPKASALVRSRGTPGILGAAKPAAPARLGRGGVFLLNSYMAGGVGGSNVKIIGGAVKKTLHASGGTIEVDADTIVDPEASIGADVDAAIDFKRAHLANQFVDDHQLSTREVDGVRSTQISTPTGTTVSVRGQAQSLADDTLRVGEALAAQLGGMHEVIPEAQDGAGVMVRGRLDAQVDVYLEAPEKADDKLLQLVRLPDLAKEMGMHDAAISIAIDHAKIQKAITSKRDCADKASFDLVVSCGAQVGDPTWTGLGKLLFDGEGYPRVWLVDRANRVLPLRLKN